DLHGRVQGRWHRERSSRQALPQGFSLQQLGDQKWLRTLEADVEERDHVRVVQRAREPCLLLETLAEAKVESGTIRDHLRGTPAPDSRVPRPVHLAHPA